jgi:hypothetical protein
VAEAKVWTEADQGAAVNKHFGEAEKLLIRANRQWQLAGHGLLDARKMVQPENWDAWCKEHIKVLSGFRDIKKAMKFAAGD